MKIVRIFAAILAGQANVVQSDFLQRQCRSEGIIKVPLALTFDLQL